MFEEYAVRKYIYENLGGTHNQDYIDISDWDALYHSDNPMIAKVMHKVVDILRSYRQVIQSTEQLTKALTGAQSNVHNSKGLNIIQTSQTQHKNILWILNRNPKTDEYNVGKTATTQKTLCLVNKAINQLFTNEIPLTDFQFSQLDDYVQIMEAYRDHLADQKAPYVKHIKDPISYEITLPESMYINYDRYAKKLQWAFHDDYLNQIITAIWARHNEDNRAKWGGKLSFDRFYDDFSAYVTDLELVLKFNR